MVTKVLCPCTGTSLPNTTLGSRGNCRTNLAGKTSRETHHSFSVSVSVTVGVGPGDPPSRGDLSRTPGTQRSGSLGTEALWVTSLNRSRRRLWGGRVREARSGRRVRLPRSRLSLGGSQLQVEPVRLFELTTPLRLPPPFSPQCLLQPVE